MDPGLLIAVTFVVAFVVLILLVVVNNNNSEPIDYLLYLSQNKTSITPGYKAPMTEKNLGDLEIYDGLGFASPRTEPHKFQLNFNFTSNNNAANFKKFNAEISFNLLPGDISMAISYVVTLDGINPVSVTKNNDMYVFKFNDIDKTIDDEYLFVFSGQTVNSDKYTIKNVKMVPTEFF